MKHYVYRLNDPITNEFYIGSRSCNCKIENDPYMGSYKTWKPEDKSRLVKTILKSNFRKRETATQYEAKLIKENINNELNRNYSLPNGNFFQLGRIFTDEHRNKLRISHLGNTHTESSKEKIAKSQYKEVYQLDSNLRIINKFISIKEAAEKTGYCPRSISLCTTKKMISHPYLQYHWCFPTDYGNFEEWKCQQNNSKGAIPIKVVLENDGVIINEFVSIKDAAEYYNISYSGIYHNLTNLTNNHKLGKWKYK